MRSIKRLILRIWLVAIAAHQQLQQAIQILLHPACPFVTLVQLILLEQLEDEIFELRIEFVLWANACHNGAAASGSVEPA